MKEMLKKWEQIKPVLWLHNAKDGDFYAFMIKANFDKRHDENFDLHDKLVLKGFIYLQKCIKRGVKPKYTLDEMVGKRLKKGGAK